jgi:hypothetical protein
MHKWARKSAHEPCADQSLRKGAASAFELACVSLPLSLCALPLPYRCPLRLFAFEDPTAPPRLPFPAPRLALPGPVMAALFFAALLLMCASIPACDLTSARLAVPIPTIARRSEGGTRG